MNTTLRILVATVSSLALAAPLAANPRIIFTTATTNGTTLAAGDLNGPVRATGGLTQLRLDSGAIVSFVGDAEFEVDGAGRLIVTSGTFTAGVGGTPLTIVTPGGGVVTMPALGSVASLQVTSTGQLSGFAMMGSLTITSGGSTRSFPSASAFSASARVVRNAPNAAWR